MPDTIPVLPPITKTHRLNLEKANERVRQNVVFCNDNGASSLSYKMAENNGNQV